jgi:hypothetical protein
LIMAGGNSRAARDPLRKFRGHHDEQPLEAALMRGEGDGLRRWWARPWGEGVQEVIGEHGGSRLWACWSADLGAARGLG